MKSIEELRNAPHLCITGTMSEEHAVYAGWVEWPDFTGTVVFGYKEGKDGMMEHVSVSHRNPHKLPTWEQMARLKSLFFNPEEMVVQVHPAESRYFHGFNGLPNVLHLWRPADGDFSILNQPERWD